MKNTVIYREQEEKFGWNVTYSPVILLVVSFICGFAIGGIAQLTKDHTLLSWVFMIPFTSGVITSCVLEQRYLKASHVPNPDPIEKFNAEQNERKMIDISKILTGLQIVALSAYFMYVVLI